MPQVITSRAIRGKGNSARVAAEYYTADYYGQEVGEWRGHLAEELGFRGPIRDGDDRFRELLGGKLGKEPLTVGGQRCEITAYDFTMSAPKSVSILAEYDPRLKQAFREASLEAFDEMERFAARRVRTGLFVRTEETRTTGNLLGALFVHDTSRDVDPQLHAHCVLANATRGEDGKIYALSNRQMCHNIEFLGRVQESILARKVAVLGYEVETVQNARGAVKGWRIQGVSEEVEERYSRGRARVERASQAELARRRGLLEAHARTAPRVELYDWLRARGETPWSDLSGRTLSPGEVDVLERRTRPEKQTLAPEERSKRILSRLSPEEHLRHHELVGRALGTKRAGLEQRADERAFERGVERVFERKSVAEGSALLADVLRHDPLADPRELERRLRTLVRLAEAPRPVGASYTTGKTVEREKAILELVDRPGGPALAPGERLESSAALAARGIDLDPDQRRAIAGILACEAPAFVLTGDAGSGKTRTLQALDALLRERGVGVEFLAPSKSGVQALGADGLAASTVASFERRGPAPGTRLVVVDEAGMLGARSGLAVLALAKERGARVLFVGDIKQNLPIDAGDFQRLLLDHSSVPQARLQEIRRQKDPRIRATVEMFAAGQAAEGLTALRDQGRIVERTDYLDEAARRAVAARSRGEETFCVAKTWAEADRISSEVRDRLRQTGQLAPEGVERVALRPYGWTEAERQDPSRYRAGMGVSVDGRPLRVEEVGKEGLRLEDGRVIDPRGTRLVPGEIRKLEVAAGDELLVRENRRGGRERDPLVNGERIRVARVEQDGAIVAADGRRIEAGFGSLDYAYARTCYGVQGPSADRAILAIGDGRTWTDNELYVGVSRCRHGLEVVTPSAEALAESRKGWAKRELVHDLSRRLEDRSGARARMAEIGERFAERIREAAERGQALAGIAGRWARDRIARACGKPEDERQRKEGGIEASIRPPEQKTPQRSAERERGERQGGAGRHQTPGEKRRERESAPTGRAPSAAREQARQRGKRNEVAKPWSARRMQAKKQARGAEGAKREESRTLARASGKTGTKDREAPPGVVEQAKRLGRALRKDRPKPGQAWSERLAPPRESRWIREQAREREREGPSRGI